MHLNQAARRFVAGGVSGYLVEELELMRWSVGQRFGLLGRQLQTLADRPGGGKVGYEGKDPPTGSLRSRLLRRRAFGACGSLSQHHRMGTTRSRSHRPF